jgi:hypothetical protein
MYKFMNNAGMVAYTIDIPSGCNDAMFVVVLQKWSGAANKCMDGIAKAEPIKV